MIIYCNGDSFTSGVDLADYLIPGYPGGTPISPRETGQQTPSIEICKNWHKNTYDNSHQLGKLRQTKMREIRNEEFNRAWPNKLHNLSGYPVINNAQSGSSMDRIARTTVSDLISLKEEHANIISIIGLTGIDRSELPSIHKSKYKMWVDIIHHRPNLYPEYKDIIDFKLQYETDYHCYTNFYKNIILVKNFCSVNNIRLYFVLPIPLPPKYWRNQSVSSNPDEKLKNWISPTEDSFKAAASGADWNKTLTNQSDKNAWSISGFSYIDIKNIKNLENYANLVPDIYMTDIANSCGQPEVYAPGGHFAESIHEIVADKLFNIIKQ